MKNQSLLRHVALWVSLTFVPSLKALEVHEWGTFTVLLSSSGETVNWYQPYSDIAKLPPFVISNPMLMKSGISAASVRMETPVIYFYPEKEMPISVRVMFADGKITERFPASVDSPYAQIESGHSLLSCSVPARTSETIFNQRIDEWSTNFKPTVTRWTGKLLPPDHADAKLIPAVDAGLAENYAAARNVPNAWLFHSDPSMFANTQSVEKFIFYRGAGQSVPPYSVRMPNDQSLEFYNFSRSVSAFQIALQVRDGKAAWTKVESVPGMADAKQHSVSAKFPEKMISLKQAEQELSALFLGELTRRGLTTAEAQAMIDTWNHTWFSEPGQRVFTIVDRNWVDLKLPLAISPEPEKMERVFVARYEILSPAIEHQLYQLLSKQMPEKQAAQQLAALDLGRFRNGAAEIVAEKMKSDMMQKFSGLNQALAESSRSEK